ncbi:hypothetical protein ABL78_2143 [Leptomonas seymouri]|uniref:Uncharacterized protein n=1 Tax=Leptomonas seymouri TaxID=5684 RepID=A0A0N1PFG6_LEPSE|nr:hypothetical protein ABL78_2143 [Leptomonas seymouri]|eukprot:KPI88764.1 hypothetical protein ABL78_2143 [Leptomonas seymouri]
MQDATAGRRQPDITATCPRLFSVLGGAVTRASLQQVQRDIDAMVEISYASTSTKSPRPAPDNARAQNASNAQSLRRVLEVLRAARRSTGNDSSANPSAIDGAALQAPSALSVHLPSSQRSRTYIRDALIQSLGVSTGSALHRECVVTPRRRIRQVVKQLAHAVRTRYLPFLLVSGPVDVHVQLFPSSAAASLSEIPAALREHGGFSAAITVRRLAALEEEADAEQKRRERYTGVAAQGQTLASALAFWSDVSYGDAPPAALADYPPLGFEADGSVNTAAAQARASIHTPAMNAANGGEGLLSQHTQRAARIGRDAEDETATTSLLLGQPESKSNLISELSGRPTWMQPGCLLSDSAMANDALSGAGSRQRALMPRVTYPLLGLVAVLYVYGSGVAYVGYPPATRAAATDTAVDMASPSTTAAPTLAAAPSVGNEDQTEGRAERPRVCTLPMLSSTGFMRSLLGFS